MAEDAGEEDCISDTGAGRPGAVFGYDDDGGEHEGEAVVDGAEAADEAEGVGVADEEGESVAGGGRGEEVGPGLLISTWI